MMLEENELTKTDNTDNMVSCEPYQLPMAAIRCGTNMEIG